jgi:hypothetical protein
VVKAFLDRGWAVFAPEPRVLAWADCARAVALARIADPEEAAKSLQCEGTWFVGVDCLPNDATGAVAQSGPLTGAGYGAAQALYGTLPLHQAQVSVIYPGYPRPRAGESEAAFRYRLTRDAAHVDGLLAIGPDRHRMLRERHAYILGVSLTECSPEASPLVVWEGSHHIMRRAFDAALKGVAPQDWGTIDLTGIYQATRREVFETCLRVALPMAVGGVCLVHRMALHGVAPWGAKAVAPPEGRMIAYFRPEFGECSTPDWLCAP